MKRLRGPSPQPSRPHTPWSPEAKRIESPIVPAFMKAVLTLSMYATPVCCASSLPYETELIRVGSGRAISSLAQLRSEYVFE